MSAFDEAPTAIIQKICEQFCLHCHDKKKGIFPGNREGWKSNHCERQFRSTLVSLSTVNKHIGSIAQCVLHHYASVSRSQDIKYYKFLRTILSNRKLARRVELFSVSPLVLDETQSKRFLRSLQPRIEEVMDMINWDKIPPRHESTFATDFEYTKKILPIVAVLRMKQLQELHVSGVPGWFLFDWLKIQPGAQVAALPDLRSLLVEVPFVHKHRVSTIEFHPVWLPESGLGGFMSGFEMLEHITLKEVMNDTVPEHLDLPRAWHISLCHSELNKENIDRFIRAAPNLREFHYVELDGTKRVIERENFMGLLTPATSEEVFDLLKPRRDTLEYVEVQTYYRALPNIHDLTALRDLTNLREVHLNTRAFCNMFDHIRRGTQVDGTQLLHYFPPYLKKITIDIGSLGLECLEDALISFCKAGRRGALRPEAHSLDSIILNMKGFEHDHENVIMNDHNPAAAEHFLARFTTECSKWLAGGRSIDVTSPYMNLFI